MTWKPGSLDVNLGPDGPSVHDLEMAKLRGVKVRGPRAVATLADDGWRGKLLSSEKGTLIRGSVENAGVLLEHHPEVCGRLQFNAFTIQAIVRRPFDWETGRVADASSYPRELTDSDAMNFCRWLERQGQHGISKDKAFGVLGAVAEANRCHPLQDYLELLEWDGKPRVEKWLSYYLGVLLDNYATSVGKRYLIGAVARALRPGCKMDTMLILEGPQGIGKSTAARVLFGDEFFTDSLSPIGSKDSAQELGGKWCIEIAELSQFIKVDQRHIKEMLSKTSDRFRPPYGRVPREYPRSCVFIGTYNPTGTGALKDETGARRFWPIRCGQIDLEALAADRDQLWAEAVALYKAGEPWWLRDHEVDAALAEQEARYDEDAWHGVVEEYLVGRNQVTTHDILTGPIGLDVGVLHDGHKRRVAQILTVLGWKVRVERAGKRTHRVYRPIDLDLDGQ